MEFTTIIYEIKDQVALITLNRPDQLNAWNGTMGIDLSNALNRANNDDDVRSIVITGAGKAFCAGADLQEGGDTFAGEEVKRNDVYPYEIDKPVIAAINGAAVGVGMTYPMLCDIRIVAEDAKLGFVFVRRGVVPELGSHLLVQRVAGFSNAADLLMSGRIFLGSEAVEMGIASAALAREEVLEAAMSKAREYVNAAPISVAITKRLLWEGLHCSLQHMWKREVPLVNWAPLMLTELS